MRGQWSLRLRCCLAGVFLVAVVGACGDSDDTVDRGADSADMSTDASDRDSAQSDTGASDTNADGSGGDPGVDDDAGDDGADDDVAGDDDAGDDDAGVDDTGDDDADDATDLADDIDTAVDAELDSDDDASDQADDDAGIERSNLLAQHCPGTVTAPGYYSGDLSSNTNDIISISGCSPLSTPGREGAVRIELEPGYTVSATYRHGGDGILYILDNCPVTTSCLDGSDVSLSGAESVSWTNDADSMNPIYVVLDSDALDGDQTFELDLFVTGPE